MADDLIEPHQAKGDLELVAVRFAEERHDSIGVAALRWRDDETGRVGESSRARLILYIECGGNIFVPQGSSRIPVEVVPAADAGGAILRAMLDRGAVDPILELPRY